MRTEFDERLLKSGGGCFRYRDNIVVYHCVAVMCGVFGLGRECRFQSVSVRKCNSSNEVSRRMDQDQSPVTVHRKM